MNFEYASRRYRCHCLEPNCERLYSRLAGVLKVKEPKVKKTGNRLDNIGELIMIFLATCKQGK